ncbi:centromere-associated protein E [Trichonephila inaurata madagascariensis]|uniref:Centromere-associated protein E n=1 Tax=Trichonephila inaurata madagascariensis TaxID=2747483 RepID=A0A8X7BRH8_9ARAC|nr:centromere-associated protein E [Trichonephila inaurata madagascariensis]
MRDNIQVAVRMRPLISREVEGKAATYWKAKPPTAIYQINSPSVNFNFDRVFEGQEENAKVYEEFCSPIVKSVIDGFNGTIFAYGQTSSGKTFTMLGDNNKNIFGIIHFTISEIFNLIQNMPEREFLLRVSYMEIYNETVRDLLSDENETLKLQEENGQIKVIGLKEHLIQEPEQMLQYMKEGECRRRTGETSMNERSSRSHSILRMIIESGLRGAEDAAVNVSHFNLVDLAGSERARQTLAKGTRFKESININQSLLGLSRVIRQLSEKEDQFISYRDSKLTRILQNSLGGNALTAIICTVTPACLEETLSTLKFASQAKCIKNKPQVNEVLTEQALLKRYANEIKKLTEKLEATKEEKAQQNKNLQEQIEFLKKRFVSQMAPVFKQKAARRETWGGCLDAARFRMALTAQEPFFIKDPISFEDDIPKSRPRSLQNQDWFIPEEPRKSVKSYFSQGSHDLSILEEECEDIDAADADEAFPSTHKRSSSTKYFSRKSSTAFSSTNAAVQTESETTYLPGNSTPKSEKIRNLTEKIVRLEKEFEELQEFTRIEKQINKEDNLLININEDKEIDLIANDEKKETEFKMQDLDTLQCFPGIVESPECKNIEQLIVENVKSNEILKTDYNINTSLTGMNERKEEILHYLESTVKILSKRKHIDLSSSSEILCGNYKTVFDMFNLILQFQCCTFQGYSKCELSKKINGALDKLNKIFQVFSNSSESKENIDDLTENFMNKTDDILKEIEMCSLDAANENNIMNQSRPFESFCDLPSFENSLNDAKSSRVSVEVNQSDRDNEKKANISINICDTEQIKENVLSSDNELKNKILALEKDLEKHLKTISDYKYDFDLKDQQISILKDKVEIQKQMINTFENELALKKDLARIDKIDASCNTSPKNVQVPFRDKACQITYLDGVSLNNSMLEDSNEFKISEQDTVNFNRSQHSNFNKSLVDNEVSLNKDCKELSQQDLKTFQCVHSQEENMVQQMKADLESTLNDLSELKLFTLEFMKSDMKKGYLGDVDAFTHLENFPLPDQIKIEITTLKEMLMRLRFYLQNQNESTEYFSNFLKEKLVENSTFKDKLKHYESTIEEKNAELEKLEEALISMEISLTELRQKLKSIGSLENKENYFDWEDDFSLVIDASKSVNCVISIQKIISEIDSVFNQKAVLIETLYAKLKEAEKELIVLQEKEQKFLELTKNVQADENLKYLELSERLNEAKRLKENVENDFKNVELQLKSLTKEKEYLQQEIDSKITFYSNKIEDLEIKFDAERQEWSKKTEECVKTIEEKCDQMLTDQENQFFDEINKMREKNNDDWQQWQLEIDQLNEQYKKNLSEIKDKLFTEIDERHNEKTKLENEIKNLKNHINLLSESKSHMKNKYKQLVVELHRQKEKVKLLVHKENVICTQERTNEKSFENKNTQTEILHNVDNKVSSDSCNQCKTFMQQIFSLQQQITQNASVEVVNESDVVYKRLQNELEAKKAKIISLSSSNANMVKEIMALKKEKKELAGKASLLHNCRCRFTFKKTEAQIFGNRDDTEKEKNLTPESENDAKPAQSKPIYDSQEILQLDIVKEAILKAREDERANLNIGNGVAGTMKCNYLQAKLNKKNKEINLLQKQLAEYRNIFQKRSTEFLPTNEPYKGLADLNENNVTYLDYHHLDIATKLQPKKTLKERNRETVNPYNLLSRAKKQEINEVIENINPVTFSPILQAEKISKNIERKDKAKETKRQIEKLVGEPECKQQ